MKISFETVDDYINSFEGNKKAILEEIRNKIRDWIPEGKEKISYQMPTFYLNGNVIHYAAFKNHVSFFPTGSGIKAFEEELIPYKKSKGTISFSFGEEIPWNLLEKIVRFKVDENTRKKKKKR
jgi:uncharacterized protein YdhG (YjbR/CyaY superfamily)